MVTLVSGSGRYELLQAVAGNADVEDCSDIRAVRFRTPIPFSKRRNIGVSCDIDQLPIDLTVEDYLDMYNVIRDVPGGWQQYHLDLTLRTFGIEDIRKLFVYVRLLFSFIIRNDDYADDDKRYCSYYQD